MVSDDFYPGILVALTEIAGHDFESVFEQIVDICDRDELVRVARKHGEMRRSGLTRYGYGLHGKREFDEH